MKPNRLIFQPSGSKRFCTSKLEGCICKGCVYFIHRKNIVISDPSVPGACRSRKDFLWQTGTAYRWLCEKRSAQDAECDHGAVRPGRKAVLKNCRVKNWLRLWKMTKTKVVSDNRIYFVAWCLRARMLVFMQNIQFFVCIIFFVHILHKWKNDEQNKTGRGSLCA